MTTAQHTDVPPASPAPSGSTHSSPPAAKPRKTTRVWLLVIVALIAAAIWYAFVYERTPRIVLITSGDGAYWDPVIEGAKDAAQQYEVDLVVDRIKSDPYVQAETMQKRLAEKPDGMAVSPLNASIQANLLCEVAGGTTLVTLDSDAPVTGRLLFVGTNNYEAGREAGENVKAAIPDGGEVIICIGNADKENTQHRRQGVIDELLDRTVEPHRTLDPMDQPVKGEKYTVVATLVDDSDPAKCTQLVADAVKKNANVKCVVGLLGYSAPAIVSGLEQGGKAGQVKVIGFDVSDETQKAVDSGAVYATIMQDQYGCGFHAVRVLAEQARDMKVGLPLYQTHMLAHRAIRKDNLADARNHGKIPQAVPPPGGAEAAAAAAAAAQSAEPAAGETGSDAPTTAPSNPS